MGVLQRLHPLSWSLWVKFLVGFLIAVAVPVALGYWSLQPSLREAAVQNLRAYLAENGDRQRIQVLAALERVRSSLSNFAADPTNNRLMTSLLLRNSPALSRQQSGASDILQVNTALQRILLDPAQPLFLDAYLLDREGTLVAFATLDTASLDISQRDQSQSPTYRAILAEQLKPQPQDQILVVRERADAPIIEIATVIYWRDGTPIGYLLAELDNSRVFYDNLRFEDAPYPAYSFLVAGEGVAIVPPQTVSQAFSIETTSSAVERARLGEVGTDIYELADGGQVVGYYTPIANSPLILVSEVSAWAARDRVGGYFGARFFVIGAGSFAFIAVLAALLNQVIAPPLARLRRAADGMADGDFSHPIESIRRGDEIGELSVAFANMRQQVQNLITDLEARIAARTRDVGATQDISRYAVSQRDLQQLMAQVVNLIVERFPSIYHAQIFLIDNNGDYAVLRASTGEAGEKLLARNHRLAVGSISVIGQVTAGGELVHARDTAASSVHRANEFLPDTRAELAIPLRVGDLLIGALDVQSKQNDAFNDDLINVLQTTADQIAIAIQNARLYEESLRRLRDIERANQVATLRAWQEYMRDQRMQEIVGAAGTSAEPAPALTALRQQAYASRSIALGEVTERRTIPLAVPVTLRGQVIGVVEWELPAESLSSSKLQLAQELANRLAYSLDNARLFESSQSLAERERVVGDIAARLTTQTDVEEILQTAVREVGQALRAPQVSIRLHNSGHANGTNGHESYE